MSLGVDDPVLFPPAVIIEVKALACELPREMGVPLSRLSISETTQGSNGRGYCGKRKGVFYNRKVHHISVEKYPT